MDPAASIASPPRISIGRGSNAYAASVLNVSAMSYGALSQNAVQALTQGAREGGFYVNTGEGGVTPHHLAAGCDVVWNLGTGYFGCRTPDGDFHPERFVEVVSDPRIKMVEIKLSQGAKPGHGGLLPAAKVTEEISQIRGIPMGQACHSPPAHAGLRTPEDILAFMEKLRTLSGKPTGFKLCVGQSADLARLVKAMVATGHVPDFLTVDGAEGGTGAAPFEFSNNVGMPLQEGLTLTHDLLCGAGLRDRVVIIASGKIASAFSVVKTLALGADVCNAARAMMFALGCIQALKCNTNTCPTGITTSDPELTAGLVVPQKAAQVYSYQTKTVEAALELVAAAGLDAMSAESNTWGLKREHVFVRTSFEQGSAKPGSLPSLEDLFPSVPAGALLQGQARPELQRVWDRV